jgi:hypothetical protein
MPGAANHSVVIAPWPQTALRWQGCIALRDSSRETLANLSITGHLRCFTDQPAAEIVQCGEPAFAQLRRASARQASRHTARAFSPKQHASPEQQRCEGGQSERSGPPASPFKGFDTHDVFSSHRHQSRRSWGTVTTAEDDPWLPALSLARTTTVYRRPSRSEP